jgi:hypothetical protein
MEFNLPEILSEVEDVFAKYEVALIGHDADTLNHYFWDDPRVVRYGVNENLYGHEEIAAFRARTPTINMDRSIVRRVISTYGRDFATTAIEFCRDGSDRTGRQMQSWVRMADGWRIVAAHVSLIGPALGSPPEVAP